MEKGDIYTLIGGFVIVIIIAIVAKPGGFSSLLPSPVPGAPVVIPATQPALTTPFPVTAPDTTQVISTPLIRPDDPPYRIFYTSTPFAYPVVRLPDNMETFGASDIPWRGENLVTFAFIEESRGGLTQKFSVPYSTWMMNITVVADKQPQYGRFRMVLCDAKTGAIFGGTEILNYGTMYKKIRVSDTEMYLIISTASIDRFRIEFETPRTIYDAERPK
ncbi:MAG: hypothetical protein WC391_04290 [Methanoregula sp.]